MHIDYAAEALLKMEQPKYSEPLPALAIVQSFVTEKEFLTLADTLGDTKISSIVKTVKAPKSRYAKVTFAQKHALAAALLAKYGTARAVYAAAFSVSQAEMFGEEVHAAPAPAVQVAPEVRAARAESAEKAATEAKFLGLPALKGTEKQITWAEQIRGEAIKGLQDTCPDELAKLLADKKAKTASYWIDSRRDIQDLINNG